MTIGNFGPVTDKADHGYFPVYLTLAAALGPRARVCELGVWHGDSLRLWTHLFPFGEVWGVDLNPAVDIPGVHLVKGDATDPELPAVLGGQFDLIVDDCSHKAAQAQASFEHLWPLVRPGGYYAVEDWFVGFPDNPWFKQNGDPHMLRFAESLIWMLNLPDSDTEQVTYRYGLAVVKKRRR
jgi:cephalosporin hydroxylase